jgi:uncharacterized membrane protein
MTTRRIGTIALCLAGLGVSLYLTLVHVTSGQVPLVCASAGLVNCEQVTTSPESTIGPVPVAVLGVVWFVGALALTLASIPAPGGPRLQRPKAVARLGWSLGGLLVILYLIYAELFLIGSICLWCTVVHVLVIALFLLALDDFLETVTT